ncbi:MAG: hypothetical protein ACQEVA_07685 [Myxococcota bacterium]
MMQDRQEFKHAMRRSFFQESTHTVLAPLLVVLACLLFGSGCAPAVGDSCETSADCPGGVSCDTTAPDGYCLVPGCTRGDCPKTSICVEFDRDISYCLESCEQDSDCRDGFACRRDQLPPDSPIGFCYIADSNPEAQ